MLCCQSAVIILGFYLPAAVSVFLVVCLAVRRCYNCSADTCVSSFCKEELSLALLTAPYLLSTQVGPGFSFINQNVALLLQEYNVM